VLDQAHRQFEQLFARRPGLIEIRSHVRKRWHQEFVDAADANLAASLALSLSVSAEVYVGVVARRRRRGRRADLVDTAAIAWADLDDADGLARVLVFRPAPTLVIASGTSGHVHAYWRLDGLLAVRDVERVNRALAARLSADDSSCEAARVLRVAGTRSHKHRPPVAVTIVEQRSAAVSVAELYSAVGPLPLARRESVSRPVGRTRLDAVAPEVYVRVLTGQRVGRSRKVRCPFHDDRNASLHVYPDPERGWYCFGCRRGGSVYDLAAALWGRPLRGREFLELRRNVQARLDLDA
jgi:hypothetical protein